MQYPSNILTACGYCSKQPSLDHLLGIYRWFNCTQEVIWGNDGEPRECVHKTIICRFENESLKVHSDCQRSRVLGTYYLGTRCIDRSKENWGHQDLDWTYFSERNSIVFGRCIYYRRFIKGFATVAKPLHKAHCDVMFSGDRCNINKYPGQPTFYF
jgi:hypothetical protein